MQDKEWANALVGAFEEAGPMFVGGGSAKYVYKGGKYLYKLWKIRQAAQRLKRLNFKQLQHLINSYSKSMNKFFKTGELPTKDALLTYRELIKRMLSGTGGAYQRVEDAARKTQLERLELIEEALMKVF